MPAISASLASDSLARLLVYGPAKARKTWWSLRAAELGFNVILCDLDYGFHVAQNLTPPAQSRIYHIDMRAPEDGYQNGGAVTLAHAIQGAATLFDEETRRYIPASRVEPDRSYLRLDLMRTTPRDVLIIDTWTALTVQLACAHRNVHDPATVNKLEWDDYAKLRLVLDHFINGLTKLPCHVIVIGHGEDWAKRKANAPVKAKPEDAIEFIRTQPMSITRSHAQTLAKNFTDVLYFNIPNAMQGTMISTKGSEDFDAGSRRLPPSLTKFDDLSFATFVGADDLAAVSANSGFSSEGVSIVSGAEVSAARTSVPGIQVGKSPITLNRNKG